jgi:hypothetical protein
MDIAFMFFALSGGAVTALQWLAASVSASAPKVAAASPTGAAVSGLLAYALARWNSGAMPA